MERRRRGPEKGWDVHTEEQEKQEVENDTRSDYQLLIGRQLIVAA